MKDLFGYDKVAVAIERLRTFEPEEGYYLAFSGGKDSIVIKDLAIKSGVKFSAHYNITTIDPPELTRYIRKYHPEVMRHAPKMNFWELMIKHKTPPTRLMRYCCKDLKEGGGKDMFVITGVRWAESSRRANRKMVESCFKNKIKKYLNLIIDWSDSDVWEYIRINKLPYCSLYDEGWTRIGCVGCPMAGKKRYREFERYPGIKKRYLKTFDKIIEARKESGLKTEYPWDKGENLFKWWMCEISGAKSDETILFE